MSKQIIDNALEIEGQTVSAALKLMLCFLLKAQKMCPGSHELIEFGTYKGRVSALLGMLARPGDNLRLVDVVDQLDKDKLAKFGVKYDFHLSSSEEYCLNLTNSKPIILSHHDASHYFNNALTELKGLWKYVNPFGLMVLDDFTDPYSQVRAAYYYSSYVEKIEFEFLLYGFGKAILVHKNNFNFWEEFVFGELQPSLREMDLLTTIYRTDVNKHARSIYINYQDPNESERYGVNVWGDQFYKPSIV